MEGESAKVVVAGVLVGEGEVVGACARKSWKERRRGGETVPLGAGGNVGKVCVCGANTGGGKEAMWVAFLMFLDARNSSREKWAVRKVAVRHVCQWKG